MITITTTTEHRLTPSAFEAFRKDLIELCNKHRVLVEPEDSEEPIYVYLSDTPGFYKLVNGDRL